MSAARLVLRGPVQRTAVLVVSVAVLIHLAMLVGLSHGPAPEHHADDSTVAVTHSEVEPRATAGPDADASPTATLMLQLCIAVLAAFLAVGLRHRLGASARRVEPAAPPRLDFALACRPLPSGPGRSRVDSGLVLLV